MHTSIILPQQFHITASTHNTTYKHGGCLPCAGFVVVVDVGGGFVLSCLSNSSLKASLNSCRFSAEMNTNSLLGPENCVICSIKMVHALDDRAAKNLPFELCSTEEYIETQ